MFYLTKCESCHNRAFYPRKRKYNFKFLPMGVITSQDKLCHKCFKEVVFRIKKTHGKLTPPLWFIIKFYVGKVIYKIKLWKKR